MDCLPWDPFKIYPVERVSEWFPVKRVFVPKDKVSWSIPWPEYSPLTYSDGSLSIMPWADPDILKDGFKPKWNEYDDGLDRRSYEKGNQIKYAVVDGLPLNPRGRTGLRGRGSLHYWGPNHTVEVILTRWRKGKTKGMYACDWKTRLPIFECVVYFQPELDHKWCLPTCFVGYKGPPSRILKNLFSKYIEDFNLNDDIRRAFFDFSLDEREIYKGYIDDPRNTDNAWIESTAVNFNEPCGVNTHLLNVYNRGGVRAKWMDIHEEKDVFPPHRFILDRVSKKHYLHGSLFVDSD